jgi:aminoglycoside phosphotransferase (APT) family kinase protein
MVVNEMPVSPPDDTIPVRADEQFDPAAVAAYLRGRLPGTEQPLAVRQFGGGAANLTYLLDYDTHEYVLRRPPLGPVAKSAHDMAREYRVLSVLHRAFPLAPRAWLYVDEPTVLDAPFLIMERRRGTVVRRTMPPHFARRPDAGRQMSMALIDALAAFHAVDYAALGLESLGRPAGFIERQIEGWYRRWQAAKVTDLPEMDAVYRWLQANRPPTLSYSLVHNDYKLDNVMFAADDPGRVVAIFDWDMCTLGDPLSDLGALLCYWTEAVDPEHFQALALMPTGDHGFMTRAELVERYADQSGRSVHDIHFYHALGLFRLAVIIAQIYIRYHRGQTQDQRFAAFGAAIAPTVRAAQDVALRDKIS